MSETKNKILSSAIKLFNEHGVARIRLQNIADDAGISVGNLAYHFKNKEIVVKEVYDKLFEDFKAILSRYLQSPSLKDFDEQAVHFFCFFQTYRFYISDLFLVEYPIPEIKAKWESLISKMILQIKKRLEFHVKKGDLIPAYEDTYNLLAEAIWMTMVFWIPQQIIRNRPMTEKRYKRAVWNHIEIYFTEQGREEFRLMVEPALH